jgi:hypothetical protein
MRDTHKLTGSVNASTGRSKSSSKLYAQSSIDLWKRPGYKEWFCAELADIPKINTRQRALRKYLSIHCPIGLLHKRLWRSSKKGKSFWKPRAAN